MIPHNEGFFFLRNAGNIPKRLKVGMAKDHSYLPHNAFNIKLVWIIDILWTFK